MDRLEMVIDAARQYGAESVQRMGRGVVHVSFREFDRQREIGFLEVQVDDGVKLLDYRQSDCAAGERWEARVSAWVLRAEDIVADPQAEMAPYRTPPWATGYSSPSRGPSTLFN